MQAWITGFQDANPDTTVSYDPVGSGGGREQFVAGGTAFARQRLGPGRRRAERRAGALRRPGQPVELPVYISPIALIYNLDGVDNLQLSPETRGEDLRRRRSRTGTTRRSPRTTRTPAARPAHHRRQPLGRVRHDRELHRLAEPDGADVWTLRGQRRLARQGRRGRRGHLRRRAGRQRPARARSATPTPARPATSAWRRSRSATTFVAPTPGGGRQDRRRFQGVRRRRQVRVHVRR